MKWEWAIDTFKVLLVSAITWVVIYLRKQAKPLLKSIKKLSKIIETVDELKNKAAILESKQEGMYDIIREPLFILNEKAEMIYANNAYAKTFGLHDPRDAYGMSWMDLIPEANRVRISQLTELKIAHPSSYDDDVEFEHKITGYIITAQCRTALIFDDDKKFKGTIGRLYVISEKAPK